MNVTKTFFTLLIAVVFISCGSDPKKMANEYCECFHNAAGDAQKLNLCGEMMNDHRSALAKDKEGTQQYSEQLMRCVVYEQKQE